MHTGARLLSPSLASCMHMLLVRMVGSTASQQVSGTPHPHHCSAWLVTWAQWPACKASRVRACAAHSRHLHLGRAAPVLKRTIKCVHIQGLASLVSFQGSC